MDGRHDLGDDGGLIPSEIRRDDASLPLYDELRTVGLRLVSRLEVDVRDGREQSEDVGCSRITAFVLLGGGSRVKASQTPAVNFVAAPYGTFDIYGRKFFRGHRQSGTLRFAVC